MYLQASSAASDLFTHIFTIRLNDAKDGIYLLADIVACYQFIHTFIIRVNEDKDAIEREING